MQEEIERILQLVEDGRLTREQAAEMIAALASAGGGDGDADTAGDAADDRPSTRSDDELGRAGARRGEWSDADAERRSFHGGRRHRRRHRHGRFVDDNLYDEIERAVSAGARALHDVMSSTFTAGTHGWHERGSTSTLSQTEAPEGADFRCRDNRFSVSMLRGLRLDDAEFCGNELTAAVLADLQVRSGSFNRNLVSGSSLKHTVVEHGDVSANAFNGAQITRLTVTRGKLTNGHFQGAQVRDLTVSDSEIDAVRCDGVRLRSVVLRADTHLRDVDLTGVAGTDWVFDDAQLSGVVLRGWRIDGFTLSHAGLEACTFRNDYLLQYTRVQYTRGRHHRRDAARARDLGLDRVVMKNCEFINCTFDGTIIRNCSVEHLRFEDVDFTGLTVSSSDELTNLARQPDVA